MGYQDRSDNRDYGTCGASRHQRRMAHAGSGGTVISAVRRKRFSRR
jgi:hypothetical protein